MANEQPTWKWWLGYAGIMLVMALAFLYFFGFTSLLVGIVGPMALGLAFVGLNTLFEQLDGKTVVVMLLGFCGVIALADVSEEAATQIGTSTVWVLVAIGACSTGRPLWARMTKAGRWDAAMERDGWDVKALRARWGADAERQLASLRANLDN